MRLIRAGFALRRRKKDLRAPARIVQALGMEEPTITVRVARPDDAPAVARVYLESWHDTYPGVLPSQLLRAMTLKGQEARWRAAMSARSREGVLVAELPRHGVVGMTSLGPAQDKALGFDGEVYTLYVAPDFMGQGVGKSLLCGAFRALEARRFRSCIIWAHAQNPARFFYETMGGRLVAERSRSMSGALVPETAFGWSRLALSERSAASGGKAIRP